MIKIRIPLQTKPRPRARVAGQFAIIYTPKEAVKYEHDIASEYVRLGGKDFGTDPIQINLQFNFQIPASFPKWKEWAIKNGYISCTIHKDVDNLAKSVFDALNGVAYVDDSQIVFTFIQKKWTTEEDNVVIDISKLPEFTEHDLKKDYKQWKKSIR